MQDRDFSVLPLQVSSGKVLDCKRITVGARQKLHFEALFRHALCNKLKQVGLGALAICVANLAATHFDEVAYCSHGRRLSTDPLVHRFIDT